MFFYETQLCLQEISARNWKFGERKSVLDNEFSGSKNQGAHQKGVEEGVGRVATSMEFDLSRSNVHGQSDFRRRENPEFRLCGFLPASLTSWVWSFRVSPVGVFQQ